MRTLRPLILVALFMLLAPLCFAAGHAEHRQHDAHVHGIGHMNLAVDGNDVYIELENPSANIVGFEHMPSSEEEQHAVHEAAEKLEDGESLFLFSMQAQCSLVSAKVSSPLLSEDHEDEHHDKEAHEEKDDDHGHAKHGSEPHDEKDEDHAHDSDKGHADHDEQMHSEFGAEYQFSCEHPDKLKSLETKLFTAFPGIEELETQVMTNSGQTGAELTKKNYRIEL